ncbi:hypothetical protein RZS08_40870, partial [Arthrospira platensis SPKY1]|nr:hypothetical protein [Arthrospira platensis SPKY1]
MGGRVARGGTGPDRCSGRAEEALPEFGRQHGVGPGRHGGPGHGSLEGRITGGLLGRVSEVEVLAEQGQGQEQGHQYHRQHEELDDGLALAAVPGSGAAGLGRVHGSVSPSCWAAAQP